MRRCAEEKPGEVQSMQWWTRVSYWNIPITANGQWETKAYDWTKIRSLPSVNARAANFYCSTHTGEISHWHTLEVKMLCLCRRGGFQSRNSLAGAACAVSRKNLRAHNTAIYSETRRAARSEFTSLQTVASLWAVAYAPMPLLGN